MAQCRWCSRSGLFLTVDQNNLCNSCAYKIYIDVNQRVRIINESIEIANKSKKLDTIVSRIDLVINFANSMIVYEEKGIRSTDTNPSELSKSYKVFRETKIMEHLKSETDALMNKVNLMQTSKTKVTALTKFLLKISDYYRVSNRQHEIKEIEDSIKKLISLNYLAGYINEAHKAEFKNNKKKALENYYEALYYLKHDEIDDDLQEDEITNLENKIRELGGQVQ